MFIRYNIKDYLLIFLTLHAATISVLWRWPNCSQSKLKLTCWLFQNVHLNNFLFKETCKIFVSKMCVILLAWRGREACNFMRAPTQFYRLVFLSGKMHEFVTWLVRWTQSVNILNALQCCLSLLYPFTVMYIISVRDKVL